LPSIDGNPDLDKDWAMNAIEYVENGQPKLMDVPMTPADFALTEGRFRKQFHKLPAGAAGVPIHEYIDLSPAEREGKTPFVWATDDERKLIKVEVSQDVVHLVRERRRNWRSLQVLAGLDVRKLDAEHNVEMEALKLQLKEATEARESSIDSIARAMSELAASSKAPPIAAFAPSVPSGPVTRLIGAAPAAAPAASVVGDGGAPLAYAEEDVVKCSNCKTCYQELPELFEKTRIVVNGETKEAGHLIPGALARVKVTPELKAKIARVAANCDAEIIHER
jgi:pyruvate-ferredoxin/flavodoxin oxidoreductase